MQVHLPAFPRAPGEHKARHPPEVRQQHSQDALSITWQRSGSTTSLAVCYIAFNTTAPSDAPVI